jgi:hypothetical protein
MTRAMTLVLLPLVLGACAGYHQEVVALRMARPAHEPAELSAYAAPGKAYPSVDGNIPAGTAPASGAAYQATTGDNPPPAPPVR